MSSIVDFHSHILPGVDDGSKSVEETLAMLRMAAEQGIEHVVATPHFYAKYDTPERFLERRREAEEKLFIALKENSGLPKISIGAEVHYFRGIGNSEAVLGLTIKGKKSILIEMPQVEWTESMYRDLELLYTHSGLTPIIAHIDRYIKPFRAKKVLDRLADLPVLIQANAEFFLTRATANMALRMLKNDQIHLLGSDSHNMEDRSPNLGKALALIEKRVDPHVFFRIEQYQRDVLGN